MSQNKTFLLANSHDCPDPSLCLQYYVFFMCSFILWFPSIASVSVPPSPVELNTAAKGTEQCFISNGILLIRAGFYPLNSSNAVDTTFPVWIKLGWHDVQFCTLKENQVLSWSTCSSVHLEDETRFLAGLWCSLSVNNVESHFYFCHSVLAASCEVINCNDFIKRAHEIVWQTNLNRTPLGPHHRWKLFDTLTITTMSCKMLGDDRLKIKISRGLYRVRRHGWGLVLCLKLMVSLK